MDKRNLTIIGSYDTRVEALTAIDQLRNEGYNKDDIVLFANATIIEQFGLDTLSSAEVEATGGSDDDRSMWEKIKDAFSFGDYDHRTIDDESDPLFAYRDDLGQDRLVESTIITQPIESKKQIQRSLISLLQVRQQCLMNRFIRPLEWEIVISKHQLMTQITCVIYKKDPIQ